MADGSSPVPVATAAPVSGWQTSELWLSMLGLGALLWALHQFITELPAIAAAPGVPSWLTPVLGLAPIGLGWLVTQLTAKYQSLRVQLKLAHLDAVSSAGDAAAAAVQTPAQADTALGVTVTPVKTP